MIGACVQLRRCPCRGGTYPVLLRPEKYSRTRPRSSCVPRQSLRRRAKPALGREEDGDLDKDFLRRDACRNCGPYRHRRVSQGTSRRGQEPARTSETGRDRLPEDLAPGEGGIITRGLHKVAIYRADDGRIVEHSASCTHLGCVVHWNSFEKCWDCPCHGSQFAPDGAVLNGPALQPLKEAER